MGGLSVQAYGGVKNRSDIAILSSLDIIDSGIAFGIVHTGKIRRFYYE